MYHVKAFYGFCVCVWESVCLAFYFFSKGKKQQKHHCLLFKIHKDFSRNPEKTKPFYFISFWRLFFSRFIFARVYCFRFSGCAVVCHFECHSRQILPFSLAHSHRRTREKKKWEKSLPLLLQGNHFTRFS